MFECTGQQNFRQAIIDFNKVIEKEPDNVAIICVAGQCYMQTGDAHSVLRLLFIQLNNLS